MRKDIIAVKSNRIAYINILLLSMVIYSIVTREEKDIILLVLIIITAGVLLYDVIRYFTHSKILIIKKNSDLIIFPSAFEEKIIPISELRSASFKGIERNNSSIILNVRDRGIQIDFIRNRKKVIDTINSLIKNVTSRQ